MKKGLEWDEEKRQKTFLQRGIDFADTAKIDWDTALTVKDDEGITVSSVLSRWVWCKDVYMCVHGVIVAIRCVLSALERQTNERR